MALADRLSAFTSRGSRVVMNGNAVSSAVHAPLTDAQLGGVAVHLALTWPVWVRRRKTSLSFVDDKTIRERHSMDFRLPEPDQFPAHSRPEYGQQIYVPITFGDKSALIKFSLHDEEDRSLVLLSAEESARTTSIGMSRLVDGLAGSDGRAAIARDSALATLQDIARSSAEAGARRAEAALAQSNVLGSVLDRDDIYKATVRNMGNQYLMLVPMAYLPGVDRLIKWEYYTVHSWNHVYNASFRFLTPVVRLTVPVLTSIGLMDKRRDFRRIPVGRAQSTHVECEPPPEARITQARMDTTQWDPTEGRRVKVRARHAMFDRPAIDLHTAPRRRRVAPGDEPVTEAQRIIDLQAGDQDFARVVVRLRPATASVVVPSVVASLATAAVLWFSLEHLRQLDGQTSAALLLLFPATTAAFLARAGEHVFSTRLLKGIRWAMAVVAACAVVSVAILGGGLVHEPSDPPATTMACAVPPAQVTPSGIVSAEDDVHCTTKPPKADDERVNPTARAWVRGAAVVASAIAFVLTLGMFLTRWRVWSRRRWQEHENVAVFEPLR